MDIAKILAETRASKGYNKSEMSRKLGIASQLYGQYESGEVKPKTEFRKKFEELFGISLIEIEDNSSNEPLTHSTGADIRAKKAFGEKEMKGVIYVPIPAQAGYSKHYYEPLFVEKLNRYPFPLPYEGDKYRVFQISGSSMEYYDEKNRPSGLFEGMDIVCEAVDAEDWKTGQIAPYHIYVVVTEDEILVKRILIKPNGDYIMHSDNPDEKPRQKLLRKQDIRELWYVKRKVDWDLAPPEKIDIII